MANFRISYTRTGAQTVEVEAADAAAAWTLITNGELVYEGVGQNVVWSDGQDEVFTATKTQEITTADQANPA